MKFIRVRGTEKRIKVGKIICLGQNYPKHAKEMGSRAPSLPHFFLKPTTSLLPDGGTVLLPRLSRCVHHEIELYFVIGKKGKNILKEEADEHILGYGIFFDITARDIQREGKKTGRPFGLSKCFDTFAPVSEITLAEEVGGWRGAQDLKIILKTNFNVK